MLGALGVFGVGDDGAAGVLGVVVGVGVLGVVVGVLMSILL